MGTQRFEVATDEKHVIKLDSKLLSHEWKENLAYAGQPTRLIVQTVFVGHKQEIVIRGYGEKKGLFDTVEDVIQYDSYNGALSVPEDMEQGDSIYFEVELPNLELFGKSGFISVKTMPLVRNLKWSKESIENEDIVTLSAEVKNVQDGAKALISIYEYDQGGAHDPLSKISTTLQDGKVQIDFQFRYPWDLDTMATNRQMNIDKDGFYPLDYFFTVTIGTIDYGKEDQESGAPTDA